MPYPWNIHDLGSFNSSDASNAHAASRCKLRLHHQTVIALNERVALGDGDSAAGRRRLGVGSQPDQDRGVTAKPLPIGQNVALARDRSRNGAKATIWPPRREGGFGRPFIDVLLVRQNRSPYAAEASQSPIGQLHGIGLMVREQAACDLTPQMMTRKVSAVNVIYLAVCGGSGGVAPACALA
jgi:hypothetical protein